MRAFARPIVMPIKAADRLYRIFIYDIIFLLTTVELTETKRNENGYQWHEKKTVIALGIFV